MKSSPMPTNTAKVRIFVDIFFVILMVLVLVPQTTGIPIHEWAGFLILIPFLFHLLINWDWIAKNSTRFLKKETNKSRFDYVLNWLLYLAMLVVTVSGIVISEAVLPLFGIHFEPDGFWSLMHTLSATLLMAILGIHIALHWRWIVGAFRKLKLKADFHHLTGIVQITKEYSRQLLLLITVSLVFSLFFWAFNYTEWADGFRISLNPEGGDQSNELPPRWMAYFLPLVKVTLLITIPALITGAILRIKHSFKKNVPLRT